MDDTKSNINFEKISSVLKENLELVGSPIAVKIIVSPEQIPEGIPEIERKIRHCKMVSLARNGQVFYATDAKHQCGGGAWALGLREQSSVLKTGEHYYKLRKYESIDSCIRTMNTVANLPQETYATLYAPLEKAEFVPKVVLIFAKPKTMLKLVQTILYRLGGRLYPQFSGIQSVCSDVISYVLLTGKPNFSFGCDGSRKFAGISDEEMVAGIPIELIEEIAQNLPFVVNAEGYKN